MIASPSAAETAPGGAPQDAFVVIPERPSKAFVDATSSYVPQAPGLHTSDSVFIDVDHDGDLDVVLSIEAGVNRLYRDERGGRLAAQPHAFGTDMHDDEHIRAADLDGNGDLDGDGKPDVLIGGWGAQARLPANDINRFYANQPGFDALMRAATEPGK